MKLCGINALRRKTNEAIFSYTAVKFCQLLVENKMNGRSGAHNDCFCSKKNSYQPVVLVVEKHQSKQNGRWQII